MGIVGRTWDLYKRSFDVLCADVEIVIFPVLSALSAILLAAGFFFPIYRSGMIKAFDPHTADWGTYCLLFLWYYLNYLVILFFNGALVGCANIRLSGGNPRVRDGFAIALRHFSRIAWWALIAATVGLILDSLKNRGNKLIGRLIGVGLGISWTLITYLIVPVIIFEDRTAFGSMERSAELFQKRWGEQLTGGIGFGILNLLLLLPGLLLAWFLFLLDHALAIIMLIWYIIILATITSAVRGIFTVVLYRYATEGVLPETFPGHLMDRAVCVSRSTF